MIRTQNEFGDIYGLDDEVNCPPNMPDLRWFTVTSHLLRIVVGYDPSAGQGCDPALPIHRRVHEEAGSSVRSKAREGRKRSHRSDDYLDQTNCKPKVYLIVFALVVLGS